VCANNWLLTEHGSGSLHYSFFNAFIPSYFLIPPRSLPGNGMFTFLRTHLFICRALLFILCHNLHFHRTRFCMYISMLSFRFHLMFFLMFNCEFRLSTSTSSFLTPHAHNVTLQEGCMIHFTWLGVMSAGNYCLNISNFGGSRRSIDVVSSRNLIVLCEMFGLFYSSN